MLQQRVLLIVEAMVKASEDEKDYARLRPFVVLTGWVTNFVKRWSICSLFLAGQGGSIYESQVVADNSKLREKLVEFDVSCTCNVDETGLLVKL